MKYTITFAPEAREGIQQFYEMAKIYFMKWPENLKYNS